MGDEIAIRLEVLPARLGDCLLVECLREQGPPWRMLVDGGPPDTWPVLEARLRDDPRVDVAVITHVDSDHIGGMIPYLTSPLAASIGEVWFNGRTHLPDLPQRSIAQGESVVAALLGTPELAGARAGGAALPWNVAWGGGPLDTGEEAGFCEYDVPTGPRITLLSPTTKRLLALATAWGDAVRDATRGGEEETGPPDAPAPLTDLAAIAAETTPKDGSVPNGSSIALLVEHRGASLVLGADAFGTVLGAGLAGVAAARGLERLEVDAVKLPHHGSKSNVLEALVAVAPARHYVVSSNGDTFHHPDDQAVARVVTGAPTGATLWFNYRNARTERWDDPALRAEHGYQTRYPEDPAAGVVLELPAR
ncbi:MAG: MBL fold metallo-hydrolase [Nocardioidaceae bacterium]